MKKNKKKKKKDIAENIDHLEFFRLLMWQMAITYPKSIYYRRLKLMTKKERKKFEEKIIKLLDDIDQTYLNRVENINEIMVNRSEICCDPWKE